MKMAPNNLAEWLAYKTMILTWPFYAVGALYVVGPVLAWVMAGLAVVVVFLGPASRSDLRTTVQIPNVIWIWIAGMAAMLVILWVGHLDWELGIKTTIKSSVGWAKGWALLALFPFAGAMLPIRREILIRGQCVVGLWTLALAPIMIAAPYIGFPERIFTSPIKAVGGPGVEYFTVYLFTFDPATWAPRWQFYAPWSPFAALLGVIMLLFALEEQDKRWKWIGICAALLMIVASKSRMGMVGMVFCTLGPRLMPLVLKGWAWMALASLTAIMAVIGSNLARIVENAVNAFKFARADSTRVRETLQRIAHERWQEEAVWFGHGTVQKGSHLVEYMPIGSHHTWYGLLFVKGSAGFLAFLFPVIYQTCLAVLDATKSSRGRLPLGIMLTILLLSLGENIEIEVYLLWPALLMLGVHARELEEDKARITGMLNSTAAV